MNTEMLAYFFPRLIDEPRRARNKLHKQPLTDDFDLTEKRYCLGESSQTKWSDDDPIAISKQLELAKTYGLSGFIVDTYVGTQSGKLVTEMTAALGNIAAQAAIHNAVFASMCCLKLARSVIPIQANFHEAGRWLDLNKNTAHAIVDHLIPLWEQEGYFTVKNKPYLSLYGLTRHPHAQQHASEFVEELRSYNHARTGQDIFLVGVGQTPTDLFWLHQLGCDGTTQYAGLPDFEPINGDKDHPLFKIASDAPELQEYQSQLFLEVERWLLLAKYGITQFMPSISLGWNASSRAVPALEDLLQNFTYPEYPQIIDESPENLRKALMKMYAYLLYLATDLEVSYIPVFAWNEVAENAALLPNLTATGKIDFSYLEVIRDFSNLLETFPPPIRS